jgi:hypothetical protein
MGRPVQQHPAQPAKGLNAPSGIRPHFDTNATLRQLKSSTVLRK